MDEKQATRQQRLTREKALYRYTTALESGDIDTLASVLEDAKHDSLLEQMILEVQDVYQDEDHQIFSSKDILQVQDRLRGLLPLWQTVGQQSEPVSFRTPRRKHRLSVLVQTIAAVLLVAIVVGSFLIVIAFHRIQTAGRSAHRLAWNVISSPDSKLPENGLKGIAVISARDAWAVGSSSSSGDNGVEQALIEHWNGSQWSIVQGENPGQGWPYALNGVVALSSNNVWAVGYAGNDTLIEHWNGNRWSIIDSPNVGTSYNILNAVAADSANDIWAVGLSSNKTINYTTSGGRTLHLAAQQTLIEHWDGSRWSVINSPAPKLTELFLNAVAVVSANDIWAVGGIYNFVPPYTITWHALVEHWNGSKWSIINTLDLSNDTLQGIAAVSSEDVWAVGTSGYNSSSGNGSRTLIEHWNGSKWSVIESPNNPNSDFNSLSGIAANSASDIWAVGSSPRTYPLQGQTLIEHWDGSKWTIISSPSPGSYNNFLITVAAIPHAGQIWAAGYFGEGYSPERTVTELYS